MKKDLDLHTMESYSTHMDKENLLDQEQEILRLENEFPSISGSAFSAARAQVLASGLSVVQSEEDALYEVFPDGRRVKIKNIEPPRKVKNGLKMRIR